MAGLLSSANQDTGTSTTSLPAWYDTAQQNIVKQASGMQAPQLGQTVAQGAINTLSGPNNPFAQATSALNNIATGASNPWITDPTTGAVTPNTNTAMGGLFAAQQAQLRNNIPGLVAQPDAQAIGSGNFGSLRGQTAADSAIAKANTDMFAQQMATALQNQQVGTQAAIGLSNVGQQGINTAMNVGQEQMVSPYNSLANYANIINGIKPGATVSTSETPSTIKQLGGLGSLLSHGVSGADSILKTLYPNGGGISDIFNSSKKPPIDATVPDTSPTTLPSDPSSAPDYNWGNIPTETAGNQYDTWFNNMFGG